jgi:hypothetical protein
MSETAFNTFMDWTYPLAIFAMVIATSYDAPRHNTARRLYRFIFGLLVLQTIMAVAWKPWPFKIYWLSLVAIATVWTTIARHYRTPQTPDPNRAR